jgi:hypothetical protein
LHSKNNVGVMSACVVKNVGEIPKGRGVVGCGAGEASQTLSVLSVPRMFMVAVGTSSNSNLG